MKKILLVFTLFISGLSADIPQVIEDFVKFAEQERVREGIPGMAIGIVQGDETLLLKGFGNKGLNTPEKVDSQTLFQIGSLSKAFTSTLVAKAVSEGLIAWDDKVIDHIPTFEMFDPWVTRQFEVADLLSQRSGLPAYAGDTQAMLGWDIQEMMSHLKYIEPISSFRSKYAYQNIFFSLAADILEKKRGKTYHELFQEEIFTPLGMSQTTSTLGDYLNATNKAEWDVLHQDGSLSQLPFDFKEREWNYIFGPAGGINSNLQDMVKWLKFQLSGKTSQGVELLKKSELDKTHQPYVFVANLDQNLLYYALGWVYMTNTPSPILWHTGATLGVSNMIAIAPEENVGIVILTNLRNSDLPSALVMEFFDRYFGKPQQDWVKKIAAQKKPEKEAEPTAITSALPLIAYTGTYKSAIYGDAEVKESNGGLGLFIGKNRTKFPLKHWDRDIFTFRWDAVEENTIKVNFFQNNDGKIDKMAIDLLTKEGGGVFTR